MYSGNGHTDADLLLQLCQLVLVHPGFLGFCIILRRYIHVWGARSVKARRDGGRYSD